MFLLSSGSVRKQCKNKQEYKNARTVQQPKQWIYIMPKHLLIMKERIKESSLPPTARGIETTLTLNADKTLLPFIPYTSTGTANLTRKGASTLEGNILTLKEEGGETFYYKVEENKVRLLNDDKQEITGALAEHYILNKE